MRFTIIIQLVNSILLIGSFYIVFYLVFMLPKQMKMNAKRLEQIEGLLRDINEKLTQH